METIEIFRAKIKDGKVYATINNSQGFKVMRININKLSDWLKYKKQINKRILFEFD